MIGEWRESLIIHPISERVTHCRWLLVVDDVVVCVNDKNASAHSIMEIHLSNLLYCQTFDSVVKDHSCSGGFCNTILEERGQVFWTAFTATGTLGFAYSHAVYIVIGNLSLNGAWVICIIMLIYHGIMYA